MSIKNSDLLKLPIAHRGLHRHPDVPENSRAAFEAAMESGLPIEMDVRLLADNQVVVFHDSNLLRLTGQDLPVSQATAAEVRQLSLLHTPQKVTLLEEVLELVRGKVPLLIELKADDSDVGALEQQTHSLLRSYAGEFAVQSFNPSSLLWFRQNAPHIWRGQLVSECAEVPQYDATRPDFIAYNLNALPCPATSRMREQGVPLLAWTIRSRTELQKATQDADNYIFDGTPELIEALKTTLRA